MGQQHEPATVCSAVHITNRSHSLRWAPHYPDTGMVGSTPL